MFETLLLAQLFNQPVITIALPVVDAVVKTETKPPIGHRGSGRIYGQKSQCRLPGNIRPDLPKCTITSLPD